MFTRAEPRKQRHRPPAGVDVYVRFTPRIFYINARAMEMLGEGVKTVSIDIDKQSRVMKVSPGGDWKLTTVCESKAMRIENGSRMLGILDAGFPSGLIGKYLSCTKDLTGALVVSLIPGFEKVA